MFRVTSLVFLFSFSVLGQTFTMKDSLRGSLFSERLCFDVNYYHLNLEIDPTLNSISGFNDIIFTVLNNFNKMQLDLFDNMVIDSIVYRGQNCDFERNYDAFYINLPNTLQIGSLEQIRVYYNGVPNEAKNPPWDGGFVWSKDKSGLPWIGVACQGMGASSWWPCKDHLSDKPDSMRVTCSVPKKLQFVGNGNLESDFVLI